MASANRKKERQKRDLFVVDTDKRKIWFINEDLVRVIHSNRAQGIITFENITKDRRESMHYVDFRKKRKRAFTMTESAKMLNIHRKRLPNLIKEGKLPPPIGALPNGERRWQHRAYYSEDTLIETRRMLAMIHWGKKRKDGLVTNNRTPSEQELTYMMGSGTMLYAKSSSGEFVPVYSETIN